MKLRLQFGGWLAALAISAAMVLPCAAQKHEANRPSEPPRQPQQRHVPRQERRQPQQENRRAQNARPNNDRPRNEREQNNVAPNREPLNGQTESMSMIGGNRAPSARAEPVPQPGFNPNRPPNASNRSRAFTPEERKQLQQQERRFRQLPPQQQQEMRERARVWNKLTAEQQNHIKGDILPKWQHLSPQRQKAIRQRLGVLQDMPESARNQHLNDPNFTRGMSEEDKAMLRDLSHMHVGAPDPPNE